MRIRSPRTQRGITLIEIMLVMAIVVAATAAVFVFSKKASVTAAVETEQRQVEQITKTVQGLFATQRNFAALGTNGASYLKDHAARSGLKFTTKADGTPVVQTGLGDGRGTLTVAAADVGFATTGPVAPGTANGFVLTYDGLTPAECIGLVTATAASTAKTLVAPNRAGPRPGATVASRGRLVADKGRIAARCKSQNGVQPAVFLYFAPARAIAPAGAFAPTPAAACNPVHESQYSACPAGQVGTIRQERDGTCTGPNNAMVYTVWTTTDSTCQNAAAAPVAQTTTDPGSSCGTSTFTQAIACPAGQVGQVTRQRTLDSCTGVYSPWTTTGDSCQAAPPSATCTPQTTSQTISCPAGQGGQIVQSHSSTCSSPTATPTWSTWSTTSNTCTSSCVANGTCCVVKRETQTTTDPCPAGTYGNSGTDQERFLGCTSSMTQSGSWTPWQTISSSGSCTACPATTTNTQSRWDPRTKACPAGETGAIAFEAEQARTQSTSYSCPAGTATLPAPTVGGWSTWADTGATRLVSDTCAAAPPTSGLRRCSANGVMLPPNGYPGSPTGFFIEGLGENESRIVHMYTYPALPTRNYAAGHACVAKFSCPSARLDAYDARVAANPPYTPGFFTTPPAGWVEPPRAWSATDTATYQTYGYGNGFDKNAADKGFGGLVEDVAGQPSCFYTGSSSPITYNAVHVQESDLWITHFNTTSDNWYLWPFARPNGTASCSPAQMPYTAVTARNAIGSSDRCWQAAKQVAWKSVNMMTGAVMADTQDVQTPPKALTACTTAYGNSTPPNDMSSVCPVNSGFAHISAVAEGLDACTIHVTWHSATPNSYGVSTMQSQAAFKVECSSGAPKVVGNELHWLPGAAPPGFGVGG